MKVLFINTVFGKGSTGNIVQDIGEVLEKNGYEYRAIYGRKPLVQDSHAYYMGSTFDAYIHAGMSRITDKAGFYSVKNTRGAIKYIKNYAPDVIHLHNLHGYYINVEMLFEYLKNDFKGKVIWTLHDCWAFTGHCVHYTYAKCEKWKSNCYECAEKKRYPSSYVFDNSKKNYQKKMRIFTGHSNLTIVTPSKWLKKQVQQSFLKEYPCVVINNGIDLDIFKPNEYVKKDGTVVNICDGLDARKGYKDLIKISSSIAAKYKVVIVGIREKEKKYLPSSVKAIGRTSNQKELVDYYCKADYLLNTTYEDTFPTVNIEALACGTPVITYDAGGSPEIISKNTGYVISVGDTDAMKRVLLRDRTINPDNCVEAAKNYSKWDKYKKYVDLYLE